MRSNCAATAAAVAVHFKFLRCCCCCCKYFIIACFRLEEPKWGKLCVRMHTYIYTHTHTYRPSLAYVYIFQILLSPYSFRNYVLGLLLHTTTLRRASRSLPPSPPHSVSLSLAPPPPVPPSLSLATAPSLVSLVNLAICLSIYADTHAHTHTHGRSAFSSFHSISHAPFLHPPFLSFPAWPDPVHFL